MIKNKNLIIGIISTFILLSSVSVLMSLTTEHSSNKNSITIKLIKNSNIRNLSDPSKISTNNLIKNLTYVEEYIKCSVIERQKILLLSIVGGTLSGAIKYKQSQIAWFNDNTGIKKDRYTKQAKATINNSKTNLTKEDDKIAKIITILKDHPYTYATYLNKAGYIIPNTDFFLSSNSLNKNKLKQKTSDILNNSYNIQKSNTSINSISLVSEEQAAGLKSISIAGSGLAAAVFRNFTFSSKIITFNQNTNKYEFAKATKKVETTASLSANKIPNELFKANNLEISKSNDNSLSNLLYFWSNNSVLTHINSLYSSISNQKDIPFNINTLPKYFNLYLGIIGRPDIRFNKIIQYKHNILLYSLIYGIPLLNTIIYTSVVVPLLIIDIKKNGITIRKPKKFDTVLNNQNQNQKTEDDWVIVPENDPAAAIDSDDEDGSVKDGDTDVTGGESDILSDEEGEASDVGDVTDSQANTINEEEIVQEQHELNNIELDNDNMLKTFVSFTRVQLPSDTKSSEITIGMTPIIGRKINNDEQNLEIFESEVAKTTESVREYESQAATFEQKAFQILTRIHTLDETYGLKNNPGLYISRRTYRINDGSDIQNREDEESKINNFELSISDKNNQIRMIGADINELKREFRNTTELYPEFNEHISNIQTLLFQCLEIEESHLNKIASMFGLRKAKSDFRKTIEIIEEQVAELPYHTLRFISINDSQNTIKGSLEEQKIDKTGRTDAEIDAELTNRMSNVKRQIAINDGILGQIKARYMSIPDRMEQEKQTIIRNNMQDVQNEIEKKLILEEIKDIQKKTRTLQSRYSTEKMPEWEKLPRTEQIHFLDDPETQASKKYEQQLRNEIRNTNERLKNDAIKDLRNRIRKIENDKYNPELTNWYKIYLREEIQKTKDSLAEQEQILEMPKILRRCRNEEKAIIRTTNTARDNQVNTPNANTKEIELDIPSIPPLSRTLSPPPVYSINDPNPSQSQTSDDVITANGRVVMISDIVESIGEELDVSTDDSLNSNSQDSSSNSPINLQNTNDTNSSNDSPSSIEEEAELGFIALFDDIKI